MMKKTKASVHVADLPVDVRRSLGVKVRKQSMTKDEVRGHALRVLNVIADLSQAERRRVLEHALRTNAV